MCARQALRWHGCYESSGKGGFFCRFTEFLPEDSALRQFIWFGLPFELQSWFYHRDLCGREVFFLASPEAPINAIDFGANNASKSFLFVM